MALCVNSALPHVDFTPRAGRFVPLRSPRLCGRDLGAGHLQKVNRLWVDPQQLVNLTICTSLAQPSADFRRFNPQSFVAVFVFSSAGEKARKRKRKRKKQSGSGLNMSRPMVPFEMNSNCFLAGPASYIRNTSNVRQSPWGGGNFKIQELWFGACFFFFFSLSLSLCLLLFVSFSISLSLSPFLFSLR